MWTNVFKIGGLHQVSWFQFLPNESDPILSDRSLKSTQKDTAAQLVLSSHLQLQKDGFLSTWANSFVGPWDPSQGLHNPDEKIKLWLFIPGRHSSVVDKAKAAVSKLRVFASGVWLAPGDSEEVAAALSQALRNCIERALMGLSYVRFGDVFSRYHPSSQGELFRRGQPVLEFIFTATDEAVFVHVIISAKHVRALSNGDMETILKRTSSHSSVRLPVIVAPHGMRGRITGICPGDLVKQLYFSSGKFKAMNGIVGLPNQSSQSSGCQLRGQNCYIEVTLGCENAESEKSLPPNSKNHISESPSVAKENEKTFIYPAEAVLVPLVQTSSARSSLKRFWLQNWMGQSLSSSSFSMQCDAFGTMDGSWHDNDMRTQHGYNSSGNSNSSSSSTSSSSDSDYRMTGETGDLEADADSVSCMKSGLTTADQMHIDGSKLGSKRSRTGMTESYGQTGAIVNASMQDGYNSMEINNDQSGSQWDWDDDDRGVVMDIQALLSEFGDFGDFFENDVLPFGEPPGTEESQTPMFSATDGGDASSSPFTGMIDSSDPMILPVGFSSFESFNPPSTAVEEPISKNQEITKDALSSGSMNYNSPAPTSSEFDYLIKAEAFMTFAPEYGAVETPTTDLLSSVIKSPYIPKSRTAESANSSTNNYIYSATPPHHDVSDDKPTVGVNLKDKYLLQSRKYYTHVESGKNNKKDEKPSSRDNVVEDVAPSAFSGFNSSNAGHMASTRNKITENLLMSSKMAIANELECIMFQAFMCKIRHTLLTPTSSLQMSRLSGSNVLYQMHGESNVLPDNISNKYDIKKKETIPVRIAGDLDSGLLDGPLNSPVGVWRTVGVTKGSKSMTAGMESFGSLSHNSFNEEGMLSYGQRQPLLELLDGMPLLFQQATSFVDVTLDADCGDGPYGWLAMQEQLRRGFSCGPALVHAGCGGVLASCHSLDVAGVELADPLSADVHASYAITLLQSDIKSALKSAFGTFDGPLTVSDWCKGRNGQTDVFSAESSASINDSSIEPISPTQSAGGSTSCLSKDGIRVDDISESEQQLGLRPALLVIPIPAILVGYQDDWLKTSATSLQHWEKAPFEPYAMQKHMNYCVICPDIDPLTTAAADFFQQLETVYETCKLGAHTPQNFGNQTSKDLGKLSSSGFVLLDCPQSMKIESDSASLVGSISDYFLSLSNGWDLTSFLKSLSKVLKALKLGSCFAPNSKEGNSAPCTVIYVVCPFPEPVAVLKTVVESCVAIGSVVFPSSDKERRTAMQNQVGKALSCSTAVDEASISNVVTISGFSIPKLVLQIVTVDAIFRVTSPSLNEPVILKDIAFTVYNKARRISRGSSADANPSISVSGRSQSHSSMMQMNSPIPGMWKDSIGPRMGPREGELDASLRAGVWDNSWQMSRLDRPGEYYIQDELKYMFEPLYILAEPGSSERGVSPESVKLLSDDGTSSDTGLGSQMDGSDDGFGSSLQKQPPSLHCCYGWTEDWRWLVCIWTDSRGELLDSCTFPFGGISSRQDTKGLQFLFVQILQQGCQILQACSTDTNTARPHDFVITRIGCFFELECQEWQKALYSIGGSEVKKWSLQLRRSVPDGIAASSNGGPLQQQEMSIIQDRSLQSHAKGSTFMKGGLGQPLGRKQLLSGGSSGGHIAMDNSKGLLQWVQSITFVSVSVDHSLQLVYQADSSPGTTQGSGIMGQSSYVEGFTPVKSLGSASTSYIFVPSPTMRFLPPNPLQLPTCLTSESQPLAHLLHSKGSAIPISTGFVVSKAVPSMRKDSRSNCKEEWPSVLSIGLFDYYGGNNSSNSNNSNNEKMKNIGKSGMENHLILERVAAELHALSWMTVSPGYLERRTALPFHCDMVLRLRRLLHFADKELSQLNLKSEV